MSDTSPGAVDLEVGLAEIDRRLREIQDELAAASPLPSPPAAAKPEHRGRSGPLADLLQRAASARRAVAAVREQVRAESPPGPTPDTEHQAQVLREVRNDLHESIVELLDRYTSALAASLDAGSATEPKKFGGDVTISAGPFASIDSLREFEQALAAIPGVQEVTRRGFEGASRAILDVRLAPIGE
jgi:hypothetical protein